LKESFPPKVETISYFVLFFFFPKNWKFESKDIILNVCDYALCNFGQNYLTPISAPFFLYGNFNPITAAIFEFNISQ
jgi:hypothetical protein